jgi:hypothetical protein
MDNNLNSHFMNDSQSVFKKIKKKIRVGILLDSYLLEAWVYTMLEVINRSDYASVELVLLNENQDEKKSFRENILSHGNNLCYNAYVKLEERASQPSPAFTVVDARNLLRNVPVLGIKSKRGNNSDWFQDQDIERIK